MVHPVLPYYLVPGNCLSVSPSRNINKFIVVYCRMLAFENVRFYIRNSKCHCWPSGLSDLPVSPQTCSEPQPSALVLNMLTDLLVGH